MSIIIKTPKSLYDSVIFTLKKIVEYKGYNKMTDRLVALLSQENEFLGLESIRK